MAQRKSTAKHSNVFPLFPTFVWETRLTREVSRKLNCSLLNRLQALMPDVECGQAWQSSHDLHELTELETLVECIHGAATGVLEFLKITYRELEITACWVTVNAPGRGHAAHAHPNSFLSGVYYVQTQDGANTINFHDPRIQTNIIRPPVSELSAANADQAVVKVSDGTLLMFPAWLRHSVDANASEKNRISVSFNLMFAAFAEQLGKPLWGE